MKGLMCLNLFTLIVNMWQLAILTGEDSGNANKLSDFLLRRYESESGINLLFPAGNMAEKFFENRLKSSKIGIDQVTCYRTQPHKDLSENIAKISFAEEAIFVFFSPSGVKNVKRFRENFKLIKIVALGPATKSAVENEGLEIAEMCEQPNVASVMKAVQNISSL